ncbi:hypothetical protein MBLNU13_g08713t1 [Cladosporium sp. NU13]
MSLRRLDTRLTDSSSLFERAREDLRARIRIRYPEDQPESETGRGGYCLSGEPQRAVEANKEVVKHLYKVSVWAASTSDIAFEEAEHDDEAAERFWRSVIPRAQLLTILLWVHSINARSRIWKDFLDLNSHDARPDRGITGLRDSDLPISSEALSARLQIYANHESDDWTLHSDIISRQLFVCAVRFEVLCPECRGAYYEDRSACSDEGKHLPLLKKSFCDKGSTAKVYRVKFAPGHFKAFDTEELAMKEFSYDDSGTAFLYEWKQSQRLHGTDLSHASVLKACAALRLKHGGLLFFPLANFNLWQYMNSENPDGPREYDKKLLWVQQLSRIAGALAFLHKEGIHHGDVKSENTLIFVRQAGSLELCIADFGNMSSSVQTSTSHALTISTKEAPNRKSIGDYCHNRAPGPYGLGYIASKGDMWSFGTVLSEVLAWFSLGKKSLDSFEKTRSDSGNDRYFSSRKQRRHLIKTVKVFELRQSVPDWFKTFLDSTPDSMDGNLYFHIWSLIKELLICDQDARLTAEQAQKELHDMGQNKFRERTSSSRYSKSLRRNGTTSCTTASTDPSASLYEDLRQAQGEGNDALVAKVAMVASTTEPGILSKCLDRAIRNCNLPVADLLSARLVGGAHVIHRAVKSRSVPFLERLAKLKAANQAEAYSGLFSDLNQQDAGGEIPLLMAIETPRNTADSPDDRLAMVSHLIRMRADVNVVDSEGETPLHYASKLAIPAIVDALLKTEAVEVNKADIGGATPLHICAQVISSDFERDHEKCVTNLLNYQARRDVKDRAGKYPLNYALDGKEYVEPERWAVVKLLCRGTSMEQYVLDVLYTLPQGIQQRCIAIRQEASDNVNGH